MDLGDTRVGRTRRLTGEPRDPIWNESFRIYCAHTVSEVVISIKDAAIVGTVVVGRARIPAYDLFAGTILSSCLQPKLLAILMSLLQLKLLQVWLNFGGTLEPLYMCLVKLWDFLFESSFLWIDFQV